MSASREEFGALILAGGRSSRMEGPLKALLPFGESTVLERVLHAFQGAGVRRIVVVTGHRGDEIAAALAGREVLVAHNAQYDQGMFSSVTTGLRALETPGLRGFFLTPVDYPLLHPAVVERVRDEWLAHRPAVVQPVCGKRGGHPPLLDAGLIPEILDYSGDGGLRKLLGERHRDGTRPLVFQDPGVVTDIDTPEDYRRALALWTRLRELERETAVAAPDGQPVTAPDQESCLALLRERGTPQPVVAHCRVVCAKAEEIARSLAPRGVRLNLSLIRAAALLHDVARIRGREHPQLGARWLREAGYPQVAEIVAVHHNLPRPGLVDEAAVVYLADKCVQGARETDLAEHFATTLDRCQTPEARAAHDAQQRQAFALRDAVLALGGTL